MAMNFHKALMASEVMPTKLITGIYQVSGTDTAVGDGALVTIGALADHDVYANMKDLNTRILGTPAAASDRVGIIDYVGVSSGTIGGNLFREGYKTFGLQVPAGIKTRVRIPELDDSGWWASGNFASTPTVGNYAVVTVGSVQMTPATSCPASGFCVKIEASKPVTEGATNTDTEYFCTVVQLA